ncbi:hypothetical protein DRN73_09170 [Candidatus Pacearchaeota archaeon]|nr:MAG: hypothetical protein DRN73_09170 [Candidatus Pacearchaeota archaeon]
MKILVYPVVGFLVASFGNALGLGGGSILVPILVFIFNHPIDKAISTNMLCVFLSSLFGFYWHSKNRNVRIDIASWVALGGIISSLTVSLFLFKYLSLKHKPLLYKLFGASLLLVIFRVVFDLTGLWKVSGGERVFGKFVKFLIGLFTGLLPGLVGKGGGVVLMPTYLYLFKLPFPQAAGTSLSSFLPMAAISFFLKALQGYVDFKIGLLIGIGTVMGAKFGAKLVNVLPVKFLKVIFAFFLSIACYKLLFY